MGDIIFLAFVVFAVGSVVIMSMRSKRQPHGDVPGASADHDASPGL